MKLTGHHLIADRHTTAGETFRAINPYSGVWLETDFAEGTAADVAAAAERAAADFDLFRKIPHPRRADFLEAVAAELLALKEPLLERCHAETGLPLPRLEGELTRTTNQLKLFAATIRTPETFFQTRIEVADPQRQPLPKPDLRLTRIPIGPVAVFGASNFPLAFSVAGGDTAAAFAAGCPVIVKGHPSHPGTSELAGVAICRAIEASRMPAGIFALIQGSQNIPGEALVRHPEIKAVAFTGSHKGGRALYNLAAARPEPIPVFAEMGSTNPIFILPGALAARGAEIAEKYIDSLTLGVGQFCTNPGIVLTVAGTDLETFVATASVKLRQIAPAPMLNGAIRDNFLSQTTRLQSDLETLFAGEARPHNGQVLPSLFKTDVATFLSRAELTEEIFGPAGIIVTCPSPAELVAAARHLQGQLTATVHAEAADMEWCEKLFFTLATKAGRLLLNDFPTGVEVCAAMNHGGPYPATTDSRWTSVGTAALNRFMRPLCYQNVTRELLPEELR